EAGEIDLGHIEVEAVRHHALRSLARGVVERCGLELPHAAGHAGVEELLDPADLLDGLLVEGPVVRVGLPDALGEVDQGLEDLVDALVPDLVDPDEGPSRVTLPPDIQIRVRGVERPLDPPDPLGRLTDPLDGLVEILLAYLCHGHSTGRVESPGPQRSGGHFWSQ